MPVGPLVRCRVLQCTVAYVGLQCNVILESVQLSRLPLSISPLFPPHSCHLPSTSTTRLLPPSPFPILTYSDAVSRHASCLETWFIMSRSWLSLDTCMPWLGCVSSFQVSSCLMSHAFIVSLSGIAKSAYSVLKHRHLLLKVGHYDPVTRRLLNYRKTIRLFLRLLLFYGYICKKTYQFKTLC